MGSKLLEQLNEQEAESRYVYLFKFRFRKGDGYKVLYKIGIANDPVARVCQVNTRFFQKRRYFAEVSIKRMRKTTEFFAIETKLHQEFKDCQWDFKDLKFDGCTEIFDVDEDILLNRYEELLPKKK